jgi:AcrR family transcriptional regulator
MEIERHYANIVAEQAVEKNYHHGDLKAALIATSLEMIAANEEHRIGFRELARRLDVSRTAPYRHFSSVEHLLATVAEQGYVTFIRRLGAVTTHPEWDARKKFLELGIAYIHFALDHPAHYRLMFDRRFFVGSAYPEIKSLSKEAFRFLMTMIQQNRPPGTPDAEIRHLSQLAWASVHGMARLFIDGQWQGVRKRQGFILKSCEQLLALV